MLHRLLPSVLAALPTCLAAQQAPFDVVGALGRGKVGAAHYSATIGFDYAAGLIRVPARLGERDCRMLLDTGAPMTVTPELKKQLGLTVLGTYPTRDSTGRQRDLEFVALPEIHFGGVHYTDLVAVVADLRAMPVLREREVEGLIGTNLLRLGALGIDYVGKTIEVTDDAGRLVPKECAVVPFATSVQGGPYLTFSLADKALPRALLDTGSNGWLQLPQKVLGELQPERCIDVHGSTGAGTFGSSREGARLVWLPGLTLGGGALPDMVVEAAVDGEARLGNRFFERTRIVLDWRTSRLWIAALAPLGRQQLRTHGVALRPENGGVVVATVLAGSAAARAGLTPGQLVLAVGDIDLRKGDLADFARAAALLRDETATAVKITVERYPKPIVFDLALERLLPR